MAYLSVVYQSGEHVLKPISEEGLTEWTEWWDENFERDGVPPDPAFEEVRSWRSISDHGPRKGGGNKYLSASEEEEG